MTLKELGTAKGLTQKQAADLCAVSLRSYVTYENDSSKTETGKYKYLTSVIEQYGIMTRAT